MSQFTANTLLPLFHALPAEEQHAFAEKIQRVLKKRDTRKKPKKSVYDRIDEIFHPENHEMLVSAIMHGNF